MLVTTHSRTPHVLCLLKICTSNFLPGTFIPSSKRRYHNTLINRELPTGANSTGKIRTRGVLRVISTLNPVRLDPSSFLDISCTVGPNVTFLPLGQASLHKPDKLKWPRFELIFRHERRDGLMKDVPFPMNTRGFLYFHSPVQLPPTAGEIRFRLTKDSNTSSFGEGTDLLTHRGVPWRIPVVAMGSDSLAYYKPIREQLLIEKLVTGEQMAACAQIFDSNTFQTNSIILHSLDQLFPITFGSGVSLWLIAGGAARYARIQRLFHDVRLQWSGSPYTGSALARLELSTRPEHAKTRTLVMRIVKILEPVKLIFPNYDGFIPEPVEGGLLPHPGLKSGVWSCKIDVNKPTARALRHLVGVGSQ